MKSPIPLWLATVVAGLLWAGCNTAKDTPISYYYQAPAKIKPHTPSRDHDGHNELTLVDLLQKMPELSVSGTGSNASVQVRGAPSKHFSGGPLWVVDGVPVGQRFAAVASAVRPAHVKSIRVLKGPQASMYGPRGAEGVIMINRD